VNMKIEFSNNRYIVSSKWGPIAYFNSYGGAEHYVEMNKKVYAVLDGNGNVDKVFSNRHQATLDGRQIVELSDINDDLMEQEEDEPEEMEEDND